MPDMGIWNGIDRLAEDYLFAGPYAYVLNNPINRFDPNGKATAPWTVMWDKTPEGTNSYWYNDGNGFTSYDGGGKGGGGGAGLAYNSTVSYDGHFTMGDWAYALPPVIINPQGNSSTWNNTANLGANSLQMYSKFTGVLGRFTYDQNSSLLADAVEFSWNSFKHKFRQAYGLKTTSLNRMQNIIVIKMDVQTKNTCRFYRLFPCYHQ